MIKMSLSFVRIVVFYSGLALVASCGSSQPEAVQDTVINFLPSSLGEITLDIESSGAYQFSQIFSVELRSPTGYPQIGVELTINSPHTVYLGTPAIVCDELTSTCTPPADAPLSLPYTVVTGSNGTAIFTVQYNLFSNQTGDVGIIEARSGTSYNSVSIPVSCGDSDTSNTLECL